MAGLATGAGAAAGVAAGATEATGLETWGEAGVGVEGADVLFVFSAALAVAGETILEGRGTAERLPLPLPAPPLVYRMTM